MQRIFIFITAIFLFSACGTDDSIKKEVEELEQLAQSLQEEREKLEGDNEDQHKENDLTQEKIDSLEYALDKCFLKYMRFLLVNNPLQMTDDVLCEIVGDSIIECWIPNITNNKILIPSFEFEGTDVSIDGERIVSGVTPVDFSHPVSLTVTSAMKSKLYTVIVHTFTGLPILWIETDGRIGLAEDNDFHTANFRLVEDCITRSAGDITEADIRIRHQGEFVTFISSFDGKSHTGKNAYVLSFDKEVALFDMPANKNWELLPNYTDVTMLRQQTAFSISKLSRLSYTPSFHYVELMLNGRYNGTYMIGDRLEVNSTRVNVGTDGYLLGIGMGSSSGNVSFTTDHMERPFVILSPQTKVGDSNYNYISDYLDKAEETLFGSDFTNEDIGWQKFLDKESFVDWYIINEILRNEEASFKSECYMSLKRGEKLKMGPLWMMLRILGRNSNAIAGLVVKNSKWYERLFQDPAFVSMVKERYSYFYQNKDVILREIDDNMSYLNRSAIENGIRWEVFYVRDANKITKLYNEEVTVLKEWLDTRMDWLNVEFNK